MRVYPPELDFPDTEKPYVESIRGRLVPKVSPKISHGIVQLNVAIALRAWAGKRGLVATEPRVYLLPRHERPSSLVPDVAYISADRFRELDGDEREKPPFAPDIAVEIWSPGDKRRDLNEKVELYFQHGSKLVILGHTEKGTITMLEPNRTTTFAKGETARCEAYPDLALDVDALLARP